MDGRGSEQQSSSSDSLRNRLPRHSRDTDTAEKHTQKTVGWQQWIVDKFNWSWFTCTQSTGGVAIMLAECPKQFHGLQTIGAIIFILNLVLFTTFTALMVTRWVSKPSLFRKCFTKAPECYFFGSFWLTIATIIIGMQRFGVPHCGPWLVVAIRVCFWIYAAVTILSTTIHFVVIFKFAEIAAIEMNPAWFLLVFNAMLTGTVAGAIAAGQPESQRLPIIVAGVGYQGFGWISSLIILTWWFGRLMEKGWPGPSQSPGLFITVGTSGYTIVALITNAQAIPKGFSYFEAHPMAPEILLVMATWVGIFMWVFTLWLFGLALFVCLGQMFRKRNGKWTIPMSFNNIWWALIFPNVGFTLSTVVIGEQLQSNAILWVSVAMVFVVVSFWLMDLVLMTVRVYKSRFVDARYMFN